MNIIIVGCGKVGRVLTEQLSKENHNICIVDMNGGVVQDLSAEFDVMGIIGNGASYSVLSEAGIENTDLLIAVTESDEQNLLCCVIAKKASKCSTIARVRNPVYNQERHFLRQGLGLSLLINPELTAAAEIAQLLLFPNAVGIDFFSKGRAEMFRFRISPDSRLSEMPLKDTSKILKDILICAVERDNEVYIPFGDFVLRAGDVVSMVTTRKNARDFFQRIKVRTNKVANAMVIGGSRISVYLAEMLSRMGISVKIIESNERRCQELCELLPSATIIHGDGGDESLLMEERLDQMDAFVALTNYDEENILLSLFAKRKVKTKVITKINRLQLKEVVHGLDLDSVVYPKYITADRILQFVRATQNSIGSNVETLYRLFDNRVEALEFKIQENSKLTGIPLQDLNLKDDILICCITRGKQMIIPGGQDQILPGDSVVVVTTRLGLQDAQDILKG